MSGDLTRRELIGRLGGGALGLGAGLALPAPVVAELFRRVRAREYAWEFFEPSEVETMRVLADTIIPADGRSGSATDAGTVEYVDFVLSVSSEDVQETWREGLAWLDGAAEREHRAVVGAAGAGAAGGAAGVPTRFVDASAGVRARVLNRFAWPDSVVPELAERAAWFTRVRDLVGAGFFTSRLGVEDIGYIGAYMRPSWEGAPPEALEELGLSYEEWDSRYGGAS